MVALKIFELNNRDDATIRQKYEHEVSLMKSLNHENIVRFKESFENSSNLYILMDLAGKTTLADILNQSLTSSIEEERSMIFIEETKAIFRQLIEALSYTHSQGISHRDIKLENVMINSEGKVTLIDFGMSLVQKDSPSIQPLSGTPIYQAPEKINRHPHDWRCGDIWAMGVCIYRAVFGKFPFKGLNENDLYGKIRKCELFFPQNCSKAVKDLILQLLHVDHLKRPSAFEIFAHQWFNPTSQDS